MINCGRPKSLLKPVDTMHLDQQLVDAAIEQALSRFPTGYAGAAALATAEGRVITSVCFDSPNEVVDLCHETGAICEANRLNLQVTASVCVSRSSPKDPFVILTPCGVCQERLAKWGLDVEVAIPSPEDPSKWQSKRLREVQPFYWRHAVEGYEHE
jgi:cytidine deaminase